MLSCNRRDFFTLTLLHWYDFVLMISYVRKQTHKKRKNSLETRAVIEISLVSWNLPNGPKHRRSILRNMASSEGNQSLARAFHSIMDKIEVDILQIAKKWNWKWIFIHQGYFFQKNSNYKCQFRSKVRAPSRLVSKIWTKYKDVPTKILKRDAKTNSS